MRRRILTCLAVLCLLPSPATHADDKEDSVKLSLKATKAAAILRQTIPKEIKSLGNRAWAGEYYKGDGLSENVTFILAPKSGYLFEWRGCLGIYDRNYGAVRSSGGKLHLSFTFPNRHGEGYLGIAEELIPVSWGDRKYLIPADAVVGFCNEVNQGDEPRSGRHGSYLLRKGDESKATQGGLPAIPEKFKPYLLAHPVEADIIGIVRDPRPTVVTINRGKRQGLLPGMELYVVQPEGIVQSAEIKKVDDERSEAIMHRVFENGEGPPVGWKVSTRCRWSDR